MWAIQWIYFQVICYGIVALLCFSAVTLGCSTLLRLWGWILAAVLVSIATVWLDVAWVQGEMAKPGWDPNTGPEMDIVFLVGAVLRAVIVNLALIPIGIAGLLLSRKLPFYRSYPPTA